MEHRVPTKTATKRTTTAGVEAEDIRFEKIPPIMAHVNHMIGEQRLLIQVNKRTFTGPTDLITAIRTHCDRLVFLMGSKNKQTQGAVELERLGCI